MFYAAWEARMATPADDGRPTRAHLIAAARRGSPFAIQQIIPPDLPLGGEYLWDWYQQIRGGLGEATMGGPAALTWPALESWARHSGANPEPHEQDALFSIDAAYRHPEMFEEAA